jgi:hypothetical protein
LRAIATSDAPDDIRLAAIKLLTKSYPNQFLWNILADQQKIIYTDSKPLTVRWVAMHFPGDPSYAQFDWDGIFMYDFLRDMPGMVFFDYEGNERVAELQENYAMNFNFFVASSDMNMEGFEELVRQCRKGMAKIRAEKVDKNDDE